jgi:hypothetical protein
MRELAEWEGERAMCNMTNRETRAGVILVCAAALAGVVLVVRAECGNIAPSGNDAEAVCQDCATGESRTGSCTWHEAEAGEPYCGACATGFNCVPVGAPASQKVTTYTNGMCGAAGCVGGDPKTDPAVQVMQYQKRECTPSGG